MAKKSKQQLDGYGDPIPAILEKPEEEVILPGETKSVENDPEEEKRIEENMLKSMEQRAKEEEKLEQEKKSLVDKKEKAIASIHKKHAVSFSERLNPFAFYLLDTNTFFAGHYDKARELGVLRFETQQDAVKFHGEHKDLSSFKIMKGADIIQYHVMRWTHCANKK